MKSIDDDVIKGFGDEWTRFDQEDVPDDELASIFDTYFDIFPWSNLPEDAVGFDLGCGTGRWAKLVAPRVSKLHCIDPSEALTVAKKNLAEKTNVVFHQADVFNIPLENESMDFGYCLGVLHHISDTDAGLRECVLRLKKGSPLLLYLYYSFENRSRLFKFVWRMTDILRVIVSRLPMPLRYFISQIIAVTIYLPISRLCQFMTFLKISTDQIPLSLYEDKSFYTMRTDALDRFGTKTEKRYSKKEIEAMMTNAGLEDIIFREGEPYWCAVGTRRS